MATIKFYKCNVCGNIITKIYDSNITPHCCNRPMTELIPSLHEAENNEHHLPCVSRIDCSTIKVVVGRAPHPMTHEHHITFIALETKSGFQIKHLHPYCQPEAIFFTTDTPVAVYSYCNIHGLWKTDVPREVTRTDAPEADSPRHDTY